MGSGRDPHRALSVGFWGAEAVRKRVGEHWGLGSVRRSPQAVPRSERVVQRGFGQGLREKRHNCDIDWVAGCAWRSP